MRNCHRSFRQPVGLMKSGLRGTGWDEKAERPKTLFSATGMMVYDVLRDW